MKLITSHNIRRRRHAGMPVDPWLSGVKVRDDYGADLARVPEAVLSRFRKGKECWELFLMGWNERNQELDQAAA